MSARRFLIAAGAVILAAVAVESVPAQSPKQLKKAGKLLESVKLVDGEGSGLDADTVQGIRPEELRAQQLAPGLGTIVGFVAHVERCELVDVNCPPCCPPNCISQVLKPRVVPTDGAVVAIQGTQIAGVTQVDGSFQLTGVPNGFWTVAGTYPPLPPPEGCAGELGTQYQRGGDCFSVTTVHNVAIAADAPNAVTLSVGTLFPKDFVCPLERPGS